MLINLLIAMLSDTYANVMAEGESRWLFERAKLILEFKDTKPPMPPPFNLLWDLFYELPRSMVKRKDCMDDSGFRWVPEQKLLQGVLEFEALQLKKCVVMQAEREQQSQDYRINELRDMVKRNNASMRMQYEHLTRQIEKQAAGGDQRRGLSRS